MTGVGRRRKGKLSPSALEEKLKDPPRTWTAKQIESERKRLRRLQNTLYGREAIPAGDDAGGRIGGICCSHRWADDCWTEVATYPPGGASTGMIRCVRCGGLVPSTYLGSSGHCADCRLEDMPAEQAAAMQGSSSVIDHCDLRRRR